MVGDKSHHEPKATDGFSTTEKIKSIIPGTAEHRAKKAAQDRIDGELPHSTIQQVEQSNLPTEGISTDEKLKDKSTGMEAQKTDPGFDKGGSQYEYTSSTLSHPVTVLEGLTEDEGPLPQDQQPVTKVE